jgi:hypothetical protein
MVVVSMLAFSTFYWQYVQQDHYNQVVLNRMQREWERFSERVEISDTAMSGSYLRFKVRNTGGVTAHIVTVYLNDTTANTARDLILANCITSNCSAYIGPGTERWVYTTIPITAGDAYDLKVATERGNIGIVSRFTAGQQGPTGTQMVPFTFSYLADDFQYNTNQDPDAPGWQKAWVFTAPSGNMWFKIKLKNTSGGEVVIETRCHLNVVTAQDKSGTGGGKAFESKAFCASSNTPVTIPKDAERWIVFGPLSNNQWWTDTNQYYVFIALFYHNANPVRPTLGATVGLLAIEVTR